MPWAQQQESEFVETSLQDLEDVLKYPLGTEYLKDPVWVVRHQIGHQVAAVLYDGKFGMYKFQFLTGGNTPKKLEGLFRTKEEIIKKAKEYLSTLPKTEDVKTIPFEEKALEETIEPEEVKEVISEAKEMQGTEELEKLKSKEVTKVKRKVRSNKKKAIRKEQKSLFEKVGG